ncbi:MAG: hypothetical protein ABSA91_13310 [Acidimicrobiales bacterium]
MTVPEESAALGLARTRLDTVTDDLAGAVLALDSDRANCLRLADHYDDFAGRIGPTYPSMAGPARALAELHRELDKCLGRLSETTEHLTGSAGRLADLVPLLGAEPKLGQPPPDPGTQQH